MNKKTVSIFGLVALLGMAHQAQGAGTKYNKNMSRKDIIQARQAELQQLQELQEFKQQAIGQRSQAQQGLSQWIQHKASSHRR